MYIVLCTKKQYMSTYEKNIIHFSGNTLYIFVSRSIFAKNFFNFDVL